MNDSLSNSPYLTVVATSRNDDHGGDPLIRTQIFITSLARQCEKFKIPAELIIVDWNPVPDRPGLAAVLNIPAECTFLKSRVITVPSELHHRIKYSEKLPLYQMIAKNVGIRRAMGKFILATNIDIVFSDELMKYIAAQDLDPSKQYRVDRYDINSGLTKELTLEQTLDYAWNNPIRTNRRYQPETLVKMLYGEELFRKDCKPDENTQAWSDNVKLVKHNGIWQIHPEQDVDMSYLHTNACGDFTMLSKEGWEAIRGYPEFAAYSFNIDSIGMIAAHYAGYKEITLLPPCVCFHIEHSAGSGWTPEWETKLFNRLRQAEILNPEWPVLTPLVTEMRENACALDFNHSGWGMSDFDLPELQMGDITEISSEQLNNLSLKATQRDVTAIQPCYDLDRLTLAHERREYTKVFESMGLSFANLNQEHASKFAVIGDCHMESSQVYIPDINGNYYEINSVVCQALFPYTTRVDFTIEKYPHNYPLRFDPVGSSGHIDIYSITAVDIRGKKLIWKLTQNAILELQLAGTAQYYQDDAKLAAVKGPVPNSYLPKSFFKSVKNKLNSKNRLPADWDFVRIVSSGTDPQILLPLIVENVQFPIHISVELRFIPFSKN